MTASAKGHTGVVKLLIDAGANIDIPANVSTSFCCMRLAQYPVAYMGVYE